jgi:predicted ATPase
VLPGFVLDRRNGPAVADLCRRLEGIPRAIELAAVRLRVLSPEQILSRIDHRFQLLTHGGAAAGPRHQTLQATLDWSYDLLTDAERTMWSRVSVFAGSFDLDAAEAVCAGGDITGEMIMDLVDGLVAKSILLRRAGRRQARYRLLDTIREYGQRKPRDAGGDQVLRDRHLSWYAGLAARHEALGSGRVEWIDRLDADHENLRAAIEFSLSEPRRTAAGLELACDLWRYWETRGHLTEGRRVLAAALAKVSEPAGLPGLRAVGRRLPHTAPRRCPSCPPAAGGRALRRQDSRRRPGRRVRLGFSRLRPVLPRGTRSGGCAD